MSAAKAEIINVKEIKFFIHETEHILKNDEITPDMTLNYYLRQVLNLKGTKKMCLEGGCGSCVVVAEIQIPNSNKTDIYAVNSCLISVLSCHGWKIYTVEGIGNPLKGYHPVQEVLAKFNGTQCGFCSSGMVMNMFALYKSGKLTMKEVENSFGGNICRCTGYRPILTAFKSLCKDASLELLGHYPDIEDVRYCHKEGNCGANKPCANSCNNKTNFALTFEKSKWIKVYDFDSLLNVLRKFKQSKYMFVSGNTARGVFKSFAAPVDVYVDIASVKELKINKIENNQLLLGANNTLTTTIDMFNEISQNDSRFQYLKKLADHIDLIANVPVRNVGTLAGNLMIKHTYPDFPSDIFLILETVGVSITISGITGDDITLKPNEFIKHDMNMKIIKYISFPSFQDNIKYESYKIMPRAQNSHAHVNAGFLFNFNKDNTINTINVVFGNINPAFIHAEKTEKFLTGKSVFDNNVLQQAYEILSQEIEPEDNPPDPAPEFRKQLAISLFYKAVLSIAPTSKVSQKFRSGATKLERSISTGAQDFDTDKSLYPLTQPIPKIEALAQTSGQAEYIEDMFDRPNQLFAAFVLSEAPPKSIIKKIDPSKALKVNGIVAYFDKKDIPGDNNFMPKPLFTTVEEIFCADTILYYHQPIGLLVGKNEDTVKKAVDLVEVDYDRSKETPLLTVRQILKAKASDRIHEEITVTPKRRGDDIKHVIKGSFDISQQYHFHMETQCCNVIPTETGLDVYPSTQWMDLTQIAISNTLKIPNNKININVRRCGGAFGAKITRNCLVSCAAALAAWKLRQPVKLSMSLPTNMSVIGKRWPLSTDYEVGVNDKGVIQYLDATHYSDLGVISNETGIYGLIDLFLGNYDSDTFTVHVNTAKTDTHPNTSTRAPGTTEGLAAIEAIMEHIAYSINVDPLTLREVNIKQQQELLKYIRDLKAWADIDTRKQEIDKFNKENRWKKRGMAVVPMAYKFEIYGPFSVTVSIYHGDGSVSVSHGGIEIGQGINTKVAQVCAYKLGIPLEKVSVLPSNSFISANSTNTGGSVTSEAVCYGVTVACGQLLNRMKPYRDQMKYPTWEELVQKCFSEYVNLSAIGDFSPKSPNVSGYTIYGIVATEVLLDVLTGQHLINRVDLIEDTGESMSPEIDIGQVEGAFVMGIGYYTTEKIVYNSDGKILTNNTWTYYPPGAKDIPIDFRVKFPKNNANPVGVLKSKATAEPPLCMSICVPLAIRNAVASARVDSNKDNSKWYPFDGTTTVENIFTNSRNNYTQYKL